jgi:hypothetical protein
MFGQMLVGLANATRDRAVQAISTLFLVPVAATAAHAAGVSTEIDTFGLSQSLLTSALWMTLGMAALFGAAGGVVAELLSLHGHIELPHKVRPRRNPGNKGRKLADPRYEFDLGIVSRMLLGAAAALALLALVTPTNATALVVNALIAGSAATGVFRAVQGKMLNRNADSASKAEKPVPGAPSLRAVI